VQTFNTFGVIHKTKTALEHDPKQFCSLHLFNTLKWLR